LVRDCDWRQQLELAHPNQEKNEGEGHFDSHPLSCLLPTSSLPTFLPLSRRWLAWQLLISHRRVIDERGNDRRGLLHVIGLNAVEHILIRVMRARVVFDLVLDELKSRQTYVIKRTKVCPQISQMPQIRTKRKMEARKGTRSTKGIEFGKVNVKGSWFSHKGFMTSYFCLLFLFVACFSFCVICVICGQSAIIAR